MRFVFLIFWSCFCFPEEPLKSLHIEHESYILDNGLKVILAQDNSTPFVAINIWYHVGAINEEAKKTGLAHLFEHLMFEGSKFVPHDQHFRILEKVGAFAFNASTSFDKTNYYMTLPKNQLELGLSLEASRMFFLDISQHKLDEQREVVRREREQRYETTPYGNAALFFWQKVFDKEHPYFGMVIGSHEDLQAAKISDVQSFYNRFYGPSNATLVIVGDFSLIEAKKLISKYFSTLPKESKTKPIKVKAPVFNKEEIFYFEEKLGKLPLIRMQYITPGLFAKGDAELDVLANILSGAASSRLTKALMRDQEMVNSINAYQQSMKNFSIFTIEALLKPGIDEKKVIQKIDDILGDIVKNPPTKTEIKRAQNSILTEYFFRIQNLGGPNGRAEILQSYDRYADDPNFMKQDVERYLNIKKKDILETIKTYLSPQKRKILIAKPIGSLS